MGGTPPDQYGLARPSAPGEDRRDPPGHHSHGAFALGTDIPDSPTFQAGATVLLTHTLQVDVRGGVGTVDSVPDGLFGAGLAVRVPH